MIAAFPRFFMRFRARRALWEDRPGRPDAPVMILMQENAR
jgi:hypothetical protein